MKTLISTLFSSILLGTLCSPVIAADKHLGDTLQEFVSTYLSVYIGEGIWDPTTAKANAPELQKRLRTLEATLGGALPPLKTIADSIRPSLAETDFEKLTTAAESQLPALLADPKRKLQVLPPPLTGKRPTDGSLAIDSYWDYNGSVAGLVIASNRFLVVCVKPAKNLEGLISPGTVLFAGQNSTLRDGTRAMMGVARLFSSGRRPVDFYAGGSTAKTPYVFRGKPTNPDGSVGSAEEVITMTPLQYRP